MLAMLASLPAAMHGIAVPLLWIIGLLLIVGGVITLVRGSVIGGIILVVLGIILGGLNVL